MSSWSDRPEAQAELQTAVAARDAEAVRTLIGEKHGDRYVDDVLADLRRDLETKRSAA